jgi:hypothetical protein
MLFPVLVAAGSVAIGAALATVPGARRALAPVRTLVLVLALAVAAISLIPTAWRALGPLSLLAVTAGLLAPWLIERATARTTTPESALSHLGSTVSFVGLLVHQVGDGMGLYAVQASVGVALALAAHTVPISALVVLDALDGGSKRTAAWRAVLMAAATTLGVGLGGAVPATLVASVDPWISAVVAGLLIHIVMHEASQGLRAVKSPPS